MPALVERLSFDVERMRAAAGDASLLATDLAEHLVGRGLPFRDAHALVGRMVAALEDQGRTLADVAPDEWPVWSELFEPEATGAAARSPEASVARRATAGGTRCSQGARETMSRRTSVAESRGRPDRTTCDNSST